MTNKDKRTDQATTLADMPGPRTTASPSVHDRRQQAEALLTGKRPLSPAIIAAMTPTAILELVHELQVHQIELAMQNEELRRTQAELTAAKERYFTLYDQAPLGFLSLNDQGKIIEANLTAATLLGTVRGVLIGQPLSRFIDVASQDRWHLYQKELGQTGHSPFCDLLMTRGPQVTFWARLQVTTADAPATTACQLALADVTAARQAEEQLRQQSACLAEVHAQMENEKRLLTAVMASLPIGVAVTDAKGGTIRANQAYEHIWGGTRPGIRPKVDSVEDYGAYKAFWADSNEPLAPEDWASAIAVQQGKATVGQMIRLQCFDGTEAYVLNSASPVYDHQGQIIGSAVALQDITELKRAEQELRRKEEDFVRAQEVGQVGSWRLDVRRNLLTWSEETYRIFGVAPATALSYQTFLACVHPEDRAMVDDRWQAALTGVDYDLEHRLMVDGQVKWVRGKAYLEFDRNGNLTGGFGITQDINQRKQAEELIKQQLEALQASNADLEQFNQAAVGRELRMIELKREINRLCLRCGLPPRYQPEDGDRNGDHNGDHNTDNNSDNSSGGNCGDGDHGQ